MSGGSVRVVFVDGVVEWAIVPTIIYLFETRYFFSILDAFFCCS